MSTLQSLDIAARSATTVQPPVARRNVTEVAKLIDVSSCIGCKACQVACMQWNDLRDEVGTNVGQYDNPSDLTPQSWTVMRFAEVQMSFEDSVLARQTDPPLTTVHQPVEAMGREMARLLVARIRGEPAGPPLTVLDTHLVVRASG